MPCCFVYISFGDSVLILASLHGLELGLAVCFRWDASGNLEGMEKKERMLIVACSIYSDHGEDGNFNCRYNEVHPDSSTLWCLVNISYLQVQLTFLLFS